MKGLRSLSSFDSLCNGQNGDLWCRLRDAVQGKSLDIEAVKVKSHAEKAVLCGEMGVREYLGNLLADAGAGAAAVNAVPTSVAKDVSEWDTRAFMIAKRLAVIEAENWEDGPRLVAAPPPLLRAEPPSVQEATADLQARVRRMGHKLHVDGAFVHCSLCRRHRRISKFDYWSHEPCSVSRFTESASAHPRASAVRVAPQEHMDAGEVEFVTPAKRRRLMRARRATAQENAATTRIASESAWSLMASGLPAYPTPPEQALSRAPMRIHSTHDCIACGGYFGCLRCGSVVGSARSSLLSDACRGACPAGSGGPIARLRAGRLPRGRAWPSGELQPLPKRYRPDAEGVARP